MWFLEAGFALPPKTTKKGSPPLGEGPGVGDVAKCDIVKLLKTTLLNRREWMGVEPTAACNATRHRF
jgi:hypothetical protein